MEGNAKTLAHHTLKPNKYNENYYEIFLKATKASLHRILMEHFTSKKAFCVNPQLHIFFNLQWRTIFPKGKVDDVVNDMIADFDNEIQEYVGKGYSSKIRADQLNISIHKYKGISAAGLNYIDE